MSALPVEPVATAVAEPNVSLVLAVTYAGSVPVIECVTPVQVVNTLLPLCGFAAPAPVLEDVAVPCRVHHGSRHDRRKPGRHGLGEFNSFPSRLLRCCDTRMPCTYCARWIHNSLQLRLRRLHSRWLDPCHFWRSSVVCTSGSQVRREQVVAAGTSKKIVEFRQSYNAGADSCTRNA